MILKIIFIYFKAKRDRHKDMERPSTDSLQKHVRQLGLSQDKSSQARSAR